MSKVVDLEGVKRGKAELRRAQELGRARGDRPARPVPVGELVTGGRGALSVPELAALTNLSPLTIRRAIASGDLQAANGGGKSHYRISRADAESWWRRRGGGTLLGVALLGDVATGQHDAERPQAQEPAARAAAILAGLDSDDAATRNAAILALTQADAQTSALVEDEVARSVAAYDGPEDDLSDWRALDSEPFHFPEEEAQP